MCVHVCAYVYSNMSVCIVHLHTHLTKVGVKTNNGKLNHTPQSKTPEGCTQYIWLIILRPDPRALRVAGGVHLLLPLMHEHLLSTISAVLYQHDGKTTVSSRTG